MVNRTMQHKAMVGRQRMRRAYLKPYTMPRYIVPNMDVLSEYNARLGSMKRGELARSLRVSPERTAVLERAELLLKDIPPDRCVTLDTKRYEGIVLYFFSSDYSRNVFVDAKLRYSICYLSKARAMQAYKEERISWMGTLTNVGDTPP